MKNQPLSALAALALGACLSATTAHAQLRISEVQSSEAGGVHDDWWEVTNLGGAPVDMTGYKFDDNSDSFALALALPSLTIGLGESVIFVESTVANPITVQGFRDWWGPTLGASVQIGVYSGSGGGLSSAGDHVNLFDSAGVLLDSVNFGAATTGTSFLYDNGAAGRSPNGLSILGDGGAFSAAQNGDIGSPGVVPEPGTLAIAGLGAAGLLLLRRRK